MSEDFKKGKAIDKDEEKDIREKGLEEMRKKEEEFQKELRDIEEVGEERKKRREEEIKRFVVASSQGEEKKIAGEFVKTGKVFRVRKEEGIFIRGKLKNFEPKIEKKLKRVHGISLEKKKEIIDAISAYNIKKSKIVLKLNDFKEFAIGLRHHTYKGKGFKDMKKYGGIDPRSLRNFKRKEIDKMRRALTGEKDPYKFQRKDRFSPSSKSARPTGRDLTRKR